MQSITVGVRDAKINLSKLLKMVQKGAEITLTDRNRPVGRIVPIQEESLPLEDRIRRLEDHGIIEEAGQKKGKRVPPPIPVPDDMAQKILERDRGDG
ncbi:MAG: type II toxin-antitoxin system prevent-host-death family antitoxin [Deltaproteobacteria bacterium]|nr:type II toxin-antitoxin system prevent-host-death family antitoxin [Deltaproteobacteria bacterium]